MCIEFLAEKQVGPTKEERNQKEKLEPRNQKEKKTDPKPRTLLDKNLEKHDLEYLCNFTRFSKREIEEWFRNAVI